MGNKRFFQQSKSYKSGELASLTGCELIGDAERLISEVATLKNATSSDISFLSNSKYTDEFKQTLAGACVIKEQDIPIAPTGINLLIHEAPYAIWAKVLELIYPTEPKDATISDKAIIDSSAKIGKGCRIEAGVVIDKHAVIGDNCVIMANTYLGPNVIVGNNTYIGTGTSLMFCNIGDDCIIHPGARIGQDGFGFAHLGAEILKVKQLGGVTIGNNVEIGANTCIDRGALEDTIIGDNTKIDNLVQIAHNVVIGSCCFIAAQTGIAGSTTLGNFVMLGGQTGIAGHLTIMDKSVIAAQSGVMHNIASQQMFSGTPAVPIRQWHKQTIALKKLAFGQLSVKSNNGNR